MKDDLAPLSQILDRIDRLLSAGLDKQRFLANEWDQDAVIRNLEIIGEAAKRVSAETRALSPSIPWRQVAGFRDVAIHGYDKLSLTRVWKIVDEDLPPLKSKVRSLLRELGPPRGV